MNDAEPVNDTESAPADTAGIPLSEPSGGLPAVIDDERELVLAADRIAGGVGPVAVDAERASGYRYGQRAYLVQVRRENAGTFLIDPIACPDLSPVNAAIGGAEWLLHAATQDLPCLADVGLTPRQLFDTELAARLLGLPRVGLAHVVRHYLGLSLAKEHSAVDWSTRPLPESWLRYAALDVEVLDELRNLMGVDLARAGKALWAREEFEALLTWQPAQRVDPWRRMSGLSALRTPRALGIARELWWARDDLAQERDSSPGRVIPDAALIDMATVAPRSAADLPRTNRAVQRYARTWLAAVDRALALPESALPPRTLPADGPPPPRAWREKNPLAAARLAATREALTVFSQEHCVPVENVVSPEPLRRVIWSPPSVKDSDGFAAALADLGVRSWQRQIIVPMLLEAFTSSPG